ncbi:hypothetical protein [Roseospira visakhapatnamensis]|uniref:Skp family chaperone for outer membrane proteins n=1 Tax=Roseospira visakhapatnamensis TaxID=390880 RepID=A0A7W6RDK2_9PROT|nr:hypothetical protein [Roseospira visakhapatnamensis]MBB4266560.1 Skp family chaperone for outer membrane proteins [Roseospira visakhapatnamensis]
MTADGGPREPGGIAAVVQALDAALEDEAGEPRPLGDPRAKDTIRHWDRLAEGVDDDALDSVLGEAVSRLAADPPGRARLLAAGLIPEIRVQTALIAGYVRLFRRMRQIARDGGLDDAALMAETRADLRRLNTRLADALTVIHQQRRERLALEAILERRERRLARANVATANARDDLRAAQAALAEVESERDLARRAAADLTAERDDLRRDLTRARAGVEDLKARYLEKFALSLHDLNRARETLYNDPGSTLPANKASVAQGYYMILEDMDAAAEAQKLMASILKEGM